MNEHIDITETFTYLDEIIDEHLSEIIQQKQSLETDLKRIYTIYNKSGAQSKDFDDLLFLIKQNLHGVQSSTEKAEILNTFLIMLLENDKIKNNACKIEELLLSVLENKHKNHLVISETNQQETEKYMEKINDIELHDDEESFFENDDEGQIIYKDDTLELIFYENNEDKEPESEEEMLLDALYSSCANMYGFFDNVQQGLITFLKDYKHLLDYYEENNLTDNEEYRKHKNFVPKLKLICNFSNIAINRFKYLYEHYEEKYDEYGRQLTL